MRDRWIGVALVVIAVVARGEVRANPSEGDGPALSQHVRPVSDKPGRARGLGAQPPMLRERQGVRVTGTLTGKTVYVSAGHGWFYTGGAWRTQRGNTHDLVEDFITIEGVDEYLIPYLQQMGAYVVPIREADRNPNLVVVDDPDAVLEGEVAELGSTDVGWGAFAAPFSDEHLAPFQLGGARAMTAAASETGRAVFPAAIPETGYYNVYVAYVQGPDRAVDAHVIVRHAGGESHLRIDQRRHGSTWMLLGRWYFEAGAGPEHASVAVANDSAQPGAVISFDAVRFGGGMAGLSHDGTTTGRAAYESAASASTQLLGAPPEVYDYFQDDSIDDVVARPRFAAWEHEDGEDAVYLSWHTNAPNPGRGTLSIAYGNTYPCCSGLDDFAGTAGSLELLDAVHGELIDDLRAGWDPSWRDAGKVTASLGELSPTHNPEMPAILVELAYHDTAADADALREPRFRQLAARAMAQGIAKYFAAKDGREVVLPPEPPSALRVENAGVGTLRVSWRPPAASPGGGDPPTGYRVYLSEHGYGFDDGVAVEGESFELVGLPRAALRFVRVAAVNAGGESTPTEVVGARLAASGAAPILVVGGFARLDASQMVRDEAALVGTVDRMWIDRMNDGTYAARHGQALADAGFAFDGATAEAVAQRDVDLAAYRALDWFAGEDGGALSVATRDELARFFLAGGSLLVSGSELVSALDTSGTPDDPLFAHAQLHVSLGNDDAGTYDVLPLDGPFAGLAPISFLDVGSGGYDADLPDVLVPGDGARPVLAYATGDAGAAAIGWDAGGSRGIVIGFPLELVQGAGARSQLVAAALAYFGVERDPDQPSDEPTEPTDPSGCGCATHGDAGSAALALVVGLVLRRRSRRAPARRCA
jgi:MYXO-CTERM domain-containing protein